MKKLLIDVKPSNSKLEDTTPRNLMILDTKPKMSELTGKLTQSYEVVLGQNMYVGLPFIPFYRDAGTVTQWSEIGMVST